MALKKPPKSASTPAVPTRVPYPQTAATAAAWIKANGLTVAGLARANNLHRMTLVGLLRGSRVGNYGQSHLGAIVLGLKPDPDLTTNLNA